MKCLDEFKYPNRITMENLIKKGTKKKLACASFDNNITKISNKLTKYYTDSNVEIIHVPVYFDLLFKVYLKNYKNLNDIDNEFMKKLSYKSPLHILNLWCSYYDEYENKQGSFIKTLNNYIQQNKCIFVYFDFHDYLIDDELTKKKALLNYSVHSTCCLIYPDYTGIYRAYYFNSHGDALTSKEAYKYNKYITRKRFKSLLLDKPLDLYVLNHIFNYINLYNKTYYDDKKHIYYYTTNNYNYSGPNLQEGDKFGVCFLFPFLLLVNLVSNYRTRFTYNLQDKKYKFTSFCKLLKKNRVDKIIKIVMCNYNKTLQTLYINPFKFTESTIDSLITDTIQKEGTKYTKYLYSNVLNFIDQKCFCVNTKK